jgi:sec-independent protein translocase protein TatA
MAMFGLGGTEILIILVLVLVFFGAGKLPEIGSALGRGVRDFRQAAQDKVIDVTPGQDEKAGEQKG